MIYLKKNAHFLFSILLLTVTITVFGPIELYFTNYEEFWFTLKDILIVSIVQMIGCIVIFTVIGLVLRGKARDLYSAILFAVGIALYVQGNYVNIDYGVLNGEAIDWSVYPVYAVLDTLCWILLIVVVIVLWIYKCNWFHKLQGYVSLYIIAVQVISLGILFFTTDVSSVEKSSYYLSDEGIFEVSAEENVIIFVLDAFDDAYFQEILQEEPGRYKEVFEDFTHFKNASAGAGATKVGMPAIIAGETYPGEISYTEYIKQSFDKDGLYTEFKKQNYDVRFYTEPTFIPDESGNLVNNQVSTGYSVSSYTQLAEKYLSLTLYKYVPHILKRFFWIYTGDFDQYKDGNSSRRYEVDDEKFFKDLQKDGLQINQTKKIFRLFHLNGTHPPFKINEYAQVVNSEDTSKICQGKGALYIVEKYISQLKELGIYDSSTIIVMADHGRENVYEHGLLVVKEKNKKKSFEESDAPVTYYDLHATLFRVLGINSGQTFFEIPNGGRKRFFYKNETEQGRMKVVEYVIEGDINDEGVIRETGIVLEPTVDNSRYYQCGTNLTFGADNTALQYIVNGVDSIDMRNYSWTDGKECEFEFELENLPKSNLAVTLDVMTIYDINGRQRVTFYVNDVMCYTETLTAGKKIQFVVPKSIIQEERLLNLRIDLPDAVSPRLILGEGQDPRTLGLAIKGLCIDETIEDADIQWSHVKEISQMNFGTEGNAMDYFLSGWYEAETGYNWSSGYAETLMKTSEICDYDVILQYGTYPPSGEINCYINNNLLAVLNGNESTVTLRIPRKLLNINGNQILAFETPNAVSPSSMGENEDNRVLGIRLYSIEITPVANSEE